MSDLNDIVKQTVQYILKQNISLEKQVSAMQQELIKRLLAELIPQLELESDGTIKNTFKNIRIIEELDKVYGKFNDTDKARVEGNFVKGFLRLNLFENRYWLTLNKSGQAFKKKLFTDALAGAKERTMYSIGLKGDGGYIKGGWLEKFVTDKTVLSDVKQFVLKSVTSQIAIKDFTDGLRGMVEGVNNNMGAFERYYRAYAYDTYSQYNNAYGNQIALGLDLQCAIYTGGLIETSRPFCEEHNGKVYTRKEIAKFPDWKDPDTGKVPSYIASFEGYNPLTDLGGFNCRHKLAWITTFLAKKLRPDVEQFI